MTPAAHANALTPAKEKKAIGEITSRQKKAGFVVKPHHDRILEAIYLYHFMTVEQVTRLFYSPGTVSTVRTLLGELEKQKYLLSFHEPRPTPFGSTPKIYTLSLQGFNRLKKQGISMPLRFREPDTEELEKNYLFLKHNLAVTDFLIAAKRLEKILPDIQLYEFFHERALKQQPPLTVAIEKWDVKGKQIVDKDGKVTMTTIKLYPDGFLDFRVLVEADKTPKRFCLLLELDRKTESELDIKRKIRGLLAAVKSGECLNRFGAKLPTIAFVNAVGGIHRRDQLKHLAEAELKKTKEQHFWAQMFVFTNLSKENAIDSKELFLSPVWYTPFQDEPTVLFRFGHNRKLKLSL